MIRGLALAIGISLLGATSAGAASGVIYDQTGAGPYSHWTSQDFAHLDDLDTEIAADFNVPEGQSWRVKRIETAGSNKGESKPPPSSARVTFYTDASGRPGQVLTSQTAGSEPVDYEIALPKPLKLAPGRYWASVQAVGGGVKSQWYWRFQGRRVGRPAMFRNVANGTGYDCTVFTPIANCKFTGERPRKQADPIFRLRGSAKLLPDGEPMLGKPKLNRRKGTAKLPVSVAGAGTLELSGRGIRDDDATVAGADTVKLAVKGKRKLKRRLRRKGTANVKVQIRYTATSGARGVARAKLELERKSGKRRSVVLGAPAGSVRLHSPGMILR